MRLPSKRSKEECGSVNTSKETAENLPHLKLAKIEYHAETPGYSAVMGHASWTRLGNNTVPKYATPLPSPSVSMPGSPATTQLPTPRVQVSASPDESTTHTKYDYELATSQMKTDAMEWNSGLDGWWQCLNLPVASATPNEPTKEGLVILLSHAVSRLLWGVVWASWFCILCVEQLAPVMKVELLLLSRSSLCE